MKTQKSQKEETPERELIHVDNYLAKYNRLTLDAIFAEVESMKSRFTEIDVPFNQVNFIKIMKDGCQWITGTLYDKLAANYKGMSAKVIQSLTEDEKAKLKLLVVPIEPIITRIKELLNKIGLTADQIPFDEGNAPVITEELKEIFAEKSMRWAVGTGEIELYHAILKSIECLNALEASLVQNGFPSLFTKYFNFEFPMPNAEIDSAFYPICLVNYDEVVEAGHAILEFNPDYFEDIRAEMKALEDRQEFESAMRSQPAEVRFEGSPETSIPAAKFKPMKEIGKVLDDFAADPAKAMPPKGHWAGIG